MGGRREKGVKKGVRIVFEKGVRMILPERPEGCCAQNHPDTLFKNNPDTLFDTLFRFANEWLLPPGLHRALRRREIRRRLRRPLGDEEAAVLSANHSLANMFAGRRCFVIGNGPSLNDEDLTPLGAEITLVMNSFHRHPVLRVWKPTFYCRAEPGESYDSPARITTIAAQTQGIDAGWYLFPIKAWPIVERHRLLAGASVHYFKPVVDLTEWPVGSWPVDLTRAMPHAGNTAHLAIMLGLYVGCSPIYLLGMDHDWLAHRSISRHFYPPSSAEVGGSDDLGTYGYATMMRDTLREWRRYEVLAQMAAQRGIRIVNLTQGSFLDVFPSGSLREVLASTRSQPAATEVAAACC